MATGDVDLEPFILLLKFPDAVLALLVGFMPEALLEFVLLDLGSGAPSLEVGPHEAVRDPLLLYVESNTDGLVSFLVLESGFNLREI